MAILTLKQNKNITSQCIHDALSKDPRFKGRVPSISTINRVISKSRKEKEEAELARQKKSPHTHIMSSPQNVQPIPVEIPKPIIEKKPSSKTYKPVPQASIIQPPQNFQQFSSPQQINQLLSMQALQSMQGFQGMQQLPTITTLPVIRTPQLDQTQTYGYYNNQVFKSIYITYNFCIIIFKCNKNHYWLKSFFSAPTCPAFDYFFKIE